MQLKDFVNLKLASADKEASAEGVPLTLENCKKYKKMRDLKVYGNCFQDGTPTPENPIEVQCVGELVTDESDVNYGKYKVPIVCRGKNLFTLKNANATTQTINGITFTPLGDERIHIKGHLADATKGVRYALNGLYIPLKAGVYRAISYNYMWTWKFHVNYGTYYTGGSMNIQPQNGAQTVPADGYINYLHISVSEGNTTEFDDIIELQVEKSNVSSAYEPHVEPITTNIFLDNPLCKTDYIDFKSNRIIRNINTLNLGNLTYIRNKYGSVYLFYAVVKDFDWKYTAGVNGSLETFCEKYSSNVQGYADTQNYSLFVGNPGFQVNCIGIRNDDYTDVSAFKASLADTLVYYTLAEPKEEFINLDLPKLNAKTTIIEVNTSLAPSNISGKYIIR